MRTPTTFLEQPKYIRSSMHAAVVTSGSLTYLVGCGVASDNCSKVWTWQDYHNNFCWSYVGRRKLRLKPYILKSRLSPRIQKTLVIYAIRMRVLHSQSNKLALYLPSGWLLPQKTALHVFIFGKNGKVRKTLILTFKFLKEEKVASLKQQWWTGPLENRDFVGVSQPLFNEKPVK